MKHTILTMCGDCARRLCAAAVRDGCARQRMALVGRLPHPRAVAQVCIEALSVSLDKRTLLGAGRNLRALKDSVER